MQYDPILLVEDDENLALAIQETLELSKYSVYRVATVAAALSEISSKQYSIIISDINLGDGPTGLDLLKEISQKYGRLPVIIITAFASIENAVEAIQLGARDYLVKPFIPEHLIALVERHIRSRNTELSEPIAVSVEMKKVLEVALRVARSSINVLITGESGTGKEVLAKYIHANSDYHEGPFIAVNAAAIPENMLESLLFGYEKGAFTGAYQSSQGKFEAAHNGTIFLDEISELPLSLQAKLLRVIQEREVERLGSKKAIKLNTRILAATNKDLHRQVELGQFREDLYFRLSVFPISIPPLLARKEDIIPLAEFILKKYCTDNNIPQIELAAQAKQNLLLRNWPGNVRELENVIQRAIVMCENNIIEAKDFELGLFHEKEQPLNSTLDSTIRDKEYTTIINVLRANNGCREKSAEILGISARTLRHKIAKMKEKGINIPKRNTGDK